jgi:hypothetical protein
MQFHYVVMYDSDTKKWSFDPDMTDNLDGNVYTEDDGFFWAAPEYPNSEIIDERCMIMLNTLASIWPEVDHD